LEIIELEPGHLPTVEELQVGTTVGVILFRIELETIYGAPADRVIQNEINAQAVLEEIRAYLDMYNQPKFMINLFVYEEIVDRNRFITDLENRMNPAMRRIQWEEDE